MMDELGNSFHSAWGQLLPDITAANDGKLRKYLLWHRSFGEQQGRHNTGQVNKLAVAHCVD